MNPQIWWYIARASGIVGWLLLTATVVWGILTPAKLSDRQRPAWFLDLHKWLAGLTVGFVAIHLAALMADSYIEFTIIDMIIPFASDWKPFPVALGVLATWLLVIVQTTSLAMKRLKRSVWRKIHLTSYLTFFVTSLHGTLAGTDATSSLYQITSVIALSTVIFTTLYRIMTRRKPRQPQPKPAAKPSAPPKPPTPTEPAAMPAHISRHVPGAPAQHPLAHQPTEAIVGALTDRSTPPDTVIASLASAGITPDRCVIHVGPQPPSTETQRKLHIPHWINDRSFPDLATALHNGNPIVAVLNVASSEVANVQQALRKAGISHQHHFGKWSYS